MRWLRTALARPSHAYLFYGPPQVGKTTAALAFAQALNCLAPVDQDACGECLECRTIAHSNHPDIHVVQPTAATKSRRPLLTVEEVRNLLEKVSWKNFRARHKVFVIQTDHLNPQGANTLLKTLEEPEPGTVMILVANRLDQVLPTVVSRCQSLAFGPVPFEAVRDHLASSGEITPERAAHVARLADGRMGWAITHATSEDLPDPTLLGAPNLEGALAEAGRLAEGDPETQLLTLETLIAQARDIMVWQETGRTDWIARSDQARAVARRKLPVAYWLRVVSRLEAARHQLIGNANTKLLWAVLAQELQPEDRERAVRAKEAP